MIRTYTDSYEWKLTGPCVDLKALPEVRGSEAICFARDGKSLLVCTEGECAPVHELRLE